MCIFKNLEEKNRKTWKNFGKNEWQPVITTCLLKICTCPNTSKSLRNNVLKFVCAALVNYILYFLKVKRKKFNVFAIITTCVI